MKTTETKLAESIANAVEGHWFLPSTVGRLLANEPLYTVDRVMELVAEIIKHMKLRIDLENNISSEGLYVANELQKTINNLRESTEFNSLKLPRSPKEIIDGLPNVQYKISAEERSWIKSNLTPSSPSFI